MFSFITNLIPANVRLEVAAIGGMVAVLALVGLYWAGDINGASRENATWQAKWNQEQAQLEYQRSLEAARVDAANDAARVEADAELEAERKREMASADLAMTLAAEAAADPNHDNIALDAEAVDRHNRRNQP